MGLWHEHSREDRDGFVGIRNANIIPDKRHNFIKHVIDGEDLGDYDYGSIMHYPERSFAIDSALPTIVSPQRIGQRDNLSVDDITAIEILYRGRTNWVRMIGRLKHISVGASGDIWGVNSRNSIFRHDNDTWELIDGSLRQISVGANGDVWGVNSSDAIWRRLSIV